MYVIYTLVSKHVMTSEQKSNLPLREHRLEVPIRIFNSKTLGILPMQVVFMGLLYNNNN